MLISVTFCSVFAVGCDVRGVCSVLPVISPAVSDISAPHRELQRVPTLGPDCSYVRLGSVCQ